MLEIMFFSDKIEIVNELFKRMKRGVNILRVRKAIIPAAGLEPDFYPHKSAAKEMLPIVDKPTIQYIVEEAIKSGIEDIIIISGRSKRAIEDHFDNHMSWSRSLKKKETMTFLSWFKIYQTWQTYITYDKKKQKVWDMPYIVQSPLLATSLLQCC